MALFSRLSLRSSLGILLAVLCGYLLGLAHGKIQQYQFEVKIAEGLDPRSGFAELNFRHPAEEGDHVFLQLKTVTLAGKVRNFAVAQLAEEEGWAWREGDPRTFSVRMKNPEYKGLVFYMTAHETRIPEH